MRAPVAPLNGLKNAASSAAVQLPPQVLTYSVRVCARAVEVSIRGARVALAAVPARNRRRLVGLGMVSSRAGRNAGLAPSWSISRQAPSGPGSRQRADPQTVGPMCIRSNPEDMG